MSRVQGAFWVQRSGCAWISRKSFLQSLTSAVHVELLPVKRLINGASLASSDSLRSCLKFPLILAGWGTPKSLACVPWMQEVGMNLRVSGQLLFQEDFQELLVLLSIKHLYLSNISARIGHRKFNVSKTQPNSSCLVCKQMLECKFFLSFFFITWRQQMSQVLHSVNTFS